MREGRGLNHPAYAFVSFYRVLEAAGVNRDDWINGHLHKVRDHAAREVRDRLRIETDNVGGHLRESGRNAAAHARSEPIIDPDDPSDARRLFSELPLIAALAELAIETELGVQTSHTVWDEHLYELAGFKAILGQELVQAILGERAPPTEHRMVDMPPISVELYGHPFYPPLTNLQPVPLSRDGDHLVLEVKLAPARMSGLSLVELRWTPYVETSTASVHPPLANRCCGSLLALGSSAPGSGSGFLLWCWRRRIARFGGRPFSLRLNKTHL
jgi:hypothetical protein